jgi:hypothetical protein
MRYLMLVCSDGVGTPEKAALMERELPAWLEDVDGRGVRVYGQRLGGVETATTVRVRDGETLVSDGPFAESKEFVAGFDVIDCDDLDEAIEVAARHPVAQCHAIEVRAFLEDGPGVGDIRPSADHSGMRYLMMMCIDGIAGTDEEEAEVRAGAEAWPAELNARGIEVHGHAIQHADAAKTIRVRDGRTLVSDGPFTEAKEFIGGFAIVDCADLDAAIELAAAHPLARFHKIEVRPFAEVDAAG